MARAFPPDIGVRATLQFPFREREDDIQSLNRKFKVIHQQLKKLSEVDVCYYSEDEKYGLYIEVVVPMTSPGMQKTIRDLYTGLYSFLGKYYDINHSL